jgi:hypothetical protein
MPAGAVHPEVAKIKFDREVANLSREGDRYRKRGAFLLAADYPTVLVGFAAPKLKPTPLLFAMLADYTDFDLQPPSIRFVDPFTSEPLKASEMPTKMVRATPRPGGLGVASPAENGAQLSPEDNPGAPFAAMPGIMVVEHHALLQDYGPDSIPFLCLAGVREYHEHPGHSGDPWELHRVTGAGSLVRLVEVVLTYAVEPAAGWGVNLMPQMSIAYGEPPR